MSTDEIDGGGRRLVAEPAGGDGDRQLDVQNGVRTDLASDSRKRRRRLLELAAERKRLRDATARGDR